MIALLKLIRNFKVIGEKLLIFWALIKIQRIVCIEFIKSKVVRIISNLRKVVAAGLKMMIAEFYLSIKNLEGNGNSMKSTFLVKPQNKLEIVSLKNFNLNLIQVHHLLLKKMRNYWTYIKRMENKKMYGKGYLLYWLAKLRIKSKKDIIT